MGSEVVTTVDIILYVITGFCTFVYIQFGLRMYLFMNLGNKQQLIAKSVLTEDTCQTRDPVSATNSVSWLLQLQTVSILNNVLISSFLILAFFSVSLGFVNHWSELEKIKHYIKYNNWQYGPLNQKGVSVDDFVWALNCLTFYLIHISGSGSIQV